MPVFRMLCRIAQSSDAHRTESVSVTVMDHEQTTGVNTKMERRSVLSSEEFFRLKMAYSSDLDAQCV